jgi:hypothetical protein
LVLLSFERDISVDAAIVVLKSVKLESVPDEANLGLGCGAPLKTDGAEAGTTVLNVGSCAGFDSFLTANVVGPTGRVIGSIGHRKPSRKPSRMISDEPKMPN